MSLDIKNIKDAFDKKIKDQNKQFITNKRSLAFLTRDNLIPEVGSENATGVKKEFTVQYLRDKVESIEKILEEQMEYHPEGEGLEL